MLRCFLGGLIFIATLALAACGESQFTPLSTRALPNASILSAETQPLRLIDAVIAQGVPERAVRLAFAFFDQHHQIIQNQSVLSIVDFTQHSSVERLYLIDLNSGAVEKLLVAHGEGSDPQNTGYARTFSNTEGSRASSLGFYLAAESYTGKYGLSIRLDGLEARNSNARERAIVIHGYDDVKPGAVGLSWGCPAIEPHQIAAVVPRLRGDSLFFAYIEGL